MQMFMSFFPLLLLMLLLLVGGCLGETEDTAHDTFALWTPETMAMAQPLDLQLSGAGKLLRGRRSLLLQQDNNNSYTSDSRWTQGGQVVQAVGRLYSRGHGGSHHYCTATAIQDMETPGRSLVLTAAHCVYTRNQAHYNMMFVPMLQDDDGTTTPDDDRKPRKRCTDDPFGCWYMKFAVIDQRWATTFSRDAISVDYAILVTSDEEASFKGGYNNKDNHVLDQAVPAMQVDMDNSMNLQNQDTAMYMGYPGQLRDFHYCKTPNLYHQDFQFTTGPHWGLLDCELHPGSSGGPGVISGNSKIFSVNSYWIPGNSTGGPHLFDNSFSCLFQQARTAPINSSTILVDYDGTPCQRPAIEV